MGSLSGLGLCREDLCIEGSLFTAVSVQAMSLSRGSLCKEVSVNGGFCPMRGSVSGRLPPATVRFCLGGYPSRDSLCSHPAGMYSCLEIFS